MRGSVISSWMREPALLGSGCIFRDEMALGTGDSGRLDQTNNGGISGFFEIRGGTLGAEFPKKGRSRETAGHAPHGRDAIVIDSQRASWLDALGQALCNPVVPASA